MVLRLLSCVPAAILAGALLGGPPSFAANAKPENDTPGITVAVAGLACDSPAAGSFHAAEVAIAALTSIGTGGAGAGKTTLTDLSILRTHDACSLPLFLLAATGRLAARVVLTDSRSETGTGLTITLENVQFVKSTLVDADSGADARETVDLSYSAVTITDSSGNSTGRIVRQPGSVPFSTVADPNPVREM